MQSDGYGYGIEAIEFGGDVGNLVTWTLDDILANTTVTGTAGNETLTGTAYADNLHGLAGNDTLNGSTGEDTLVGGEGNDALDGGVGSDRYVWSKGDGNDNINDSHNSQTEIDTLVLSDVSSDDVSLTRLNGTNHLMIEIISTGETIQITNRYYSYYTTTYGYGIEAIEFGGDGVTWTLDDILAAATFTGTSGNETLTGSSRRDNMFGLEGNDTLNGGGGDDVITGGLGVDALDGGYGSDRYEWSKGDGNDALYDSINSLTDVDTLALLDVTSDDVRLTRANGSNHLMIEIISTGEEITIHNQFSASGHNRALEQLEFADGSVLDLTDTTSLKRVITGSSGDNELHGKALDDVLLGKAGNDNLVGDSGADFLSGGTGEDQLNGGSGSDILIGGSGADTLVGGTGLGGFTKAQSNGNGSTNNGLVKTSGGTGWNGGAYSKESFTGAGSGAGSVTTTVAKTGHHVMVGLSDQAEDASTKNIDYALYQYVNGTLHIYESGVSKGQFGAYAIGDELTVERLEDGTVQYLKNGIVLYTSAKISSPHVALSADASMYEEGSRIGQTKLAVNGAEQNVEWVVENHVENDTLGTDLKTDYVDVDGDGNVDIVLSNDVGEVWTRTGSGDGTFNDVVGQGIGSGSNVLTKVSGGAAWNGGAHSVESFIGAGKVTSTPLTSTTQAHVGLSAASTLSAEGSYATIDYSLGMWSDSQIRIFENGVFRGIFSTYTEGDTVSVERLDNGTVQYLKNDVVIYTSTIASPTDIELGVDTSLYGGKLGDTTLQVGTNNAELVNWVVENHVANDTLGANLKADYVDINGDGNVDIVLSSDVGEVWTRTGNGDGTFDDVVEHGDGSTSNTLTKTSGGTGWNGGAYSKQSFTGSGATSTTSVSTGHHVMTGLSNSPEDAGYGSIDFAWYQTPGGVLYIYESGASRGQFGTYAVGDELTVERLNDGTVQYLQNGNLIYTSTVNSPTSEALSADSSIHWQGNQIGNTTLQVGSNAAELVDWAVNGHITVDPIDTDLQTDYVDVDGDGNVDIVLSNDVGEVWTRTGSGDGTFNDAVEHGDGSISEPGTQENPLNVSYVDMDGDGNVDIALSNTNGKVWTRTGNGDGSFGEAIAQGAGSNSKELVKTAGGSAWNGGAYSNKSFTGAGTFSTVVVSTGHYVVVGLSEAAQDGGYNNMNFALYQNPGGNLYIYESGVSKGIFGTYKVGDVLSIKRLDDGTVQYLKNDTVIHTSDTVSQLDVELTVDASLYYQDSRLGDTTLQIGNGDPELVDWITNAYVEVGSFGSNLQTNFVDVDGDNRVDTLMSSELGENWIRYGKDDVDTFRFTDIDDSTQTNADTIVDFDIEYDLLDLSELDVSFDDIEITEESGRTEVSITDTDFMIRLTGTGLGLAEDQFLF